MIPLVVVLIAGFATTLYVMYRNLYSNYSKLLGALRMFGIFSLGGHHLLLVSH